MPRRYRKKTVSKATALSKKSAAAQARQIVKLQNQITRNRTLLGDTSQWVQYQFPQGQVIGGVHPEYGVLNMIQPYAWTAIFQTQKNGDDQMRSDNKFRGNNLRIEGLIQLEDPEESPTPVTGTIFVVKLKKEVAKQFIHRTGNGANLVDGVDFCSANLGTIQGSGAVLLNRGQFDVIRTRRFMIGAETNFLQDDPLGEPTRTTNLKDNNFRYNFTIPYKNILKSDGPNSRTANGTGGFRTLTVDTVEPHDQIYIFCFTNNYGGQVVAHNTNCVISGKVTNT